MAFMAVPVSDLESAPSSHPADVRIGVVHAVAYSLLLLNTDLHVADLNSRMSRNQFVRNTLTAIQMQLPGPTPALASDLTYDDYGSLRGGASTDGAETIKSTGRSKRSGSITSWKSMSRDAIMTSPAAVSTSNLNGSSASVQVTPGHEAKPNNSSSSSVVYGRNWESEMENLLKASTLLSIEFSLHLTAAT